MRDSEIRIELVCDEPGLRALKDEWETLWLKAQGRYFQRFDVCLLAWLHVAKPRRRKLRCIVLRENGELRLVWPLVAYRRALWTYLLPLSPDAGDYTSVLVEDGQDARALIERAWRIACERFKTDFIHLPYMNEGSELHRIASAERHILGRSRHESWIAKLRDESDWKTFSGSLGTMFGKKPGQLERRLAKEGALSIRMVNTSDTEAIARYVRWMLESKRGWSDRVGKCGKWLFSPYYERFLISTLTYRGETSDKEPPARLVMVTLDDQPMAAVIMSHGNPMANAVIAGFNAEYGRFGPGSIAWEHSVKWAFEQRYDIDFGVGSERFKTYWSRNNGSHAWTMQIANTTWGLIGYRVVRTLRDLVSAARGTSKGTPAPEGESASARGKG
jgi:CelD/BcsL family acetyltransferase involved in cellulose biosynthesis